MEITNRLLNTILCPVTKKPLENPYMVNCSRRHNIEYRVIEANFSHLYIWHCPVCLEGITAYWPNPSLKVLIEFLRNKPIYDSPTQVVDSNNVLSYRDYPLAPCHFDKLQQSDDLRLKSRIFHSQSGPISMMQVSLCKNADGNWQANGTFGIYIQCKDIVSIKQMYFHMRLKGLPLDDLPKYSTNLSKYTQDFNIFHPIVKYVMENNKFSNDCQTALEEFLSTCKDY